MYSNDSLTELCKHFVHPILFYAIFSIQKSALSIEWIKSVQTAHLHAQTKFPVGDYSDVDLASQTFAVAATTER